MMVFVNNVKNETFRKLHRTVRSSGDDITRGFILLAALYLFSRRSLFYSGILSFSKRKKNLILE